MITLLLIAANVLVSLKAFNAFRLNRNPERFLMIPADLAAGRNFSGAIASQFSHADAGHLLFNMLTLYFFGPVVEADLGPLSMLLLYVVAGIASALPVYVAHRTNPRYRSLGASGSISGVVFGAIVLRPGLNLMLFFVPVPIPGPLFALGYLALSTVLAMRQRGVISHEAHIGGAIAGFLLAGALSPEGFAPLLERTSALFR